MVFQGNHKCYIECGIIVMLSGRWQGDFYGILLGKVKKLSEIHRSDRPTDD